MSAQTSISKKETFKLFVSFLKQEGAYLSFTYYLQTSQRISLSINVFYTTSVFHPVKLISLAFSFRKTQEGYLYWDKLADKWSDFYFQNTLNS